MLQTPHQSFYPLIHTSYGAKNVENVSCYLVTLLTITGEQLIPSTKLVIPIHLSEDDFFWNVFMELKCPLSSFLALGFFLRDLSLYDSLISVWSVSCDLHKVFIVRNIPTNKKKAREKQFKKCTTTVFMGSGNYAIFACGIVHHRYIHTMNVELQLQTHYYR